ncbi:class I SAM-dependent methyltransferase [Winogradskyella alexanderae]|uniref:Class I SAM-dependent methyltransferase n=1 Tax=Winogradskyella alexanderae TaxID=2877123 RepID=A0ABS7XWL6_9FLAO|nr:class I SAM-dependent methyltransferase [Winogradskyella alexanderae]MCA0133401.1 class I SAM-dependent methyltransferase [Winogradskyella alexanderae]
MSSSKNPWPTKDAMMQIYEKHLWGGEEYDFYSGYGSHDLQIVQPYVDTVRAFFESHNQNLTVCDFGCGDFNIGKRLVQHTSKYIAIDIVPSLIERNKKLFKASNLEFHCLDISQDKLPEADCVILRQVLQHLSNKEVKRIVKKLINYRFIILTENLPSSKFTRNTDIISGQGIRLKHNSGIDLLVQPFNLKVKSTKILSEVILEHKKGKIVSWLYELF